MNESFVLHYSSVDDAAEPSKSSFERMNDTSEVQTCLLMNITPPPPTDYNDTVNVVNGVNT